MLFCKSSTVKVGTIALICTASCVVATIASFCFVVFVHPQASGPRPDLQARPCEKNFCGDGRAWAVAAAPRGAAVARRSVTAEAGHVEAQYNLASMLAEGEGCDRDLPAAREWLRRAVSG